ncbi:uncharacterized protein [Physcomitrium patens]|uniref:Uncharacterized protein n=1 Tax=Physcomitrium patens TaxID=3218 RepID=A0A2K1KF75_PHYPA|nr:uncharacterized protein LOC112283783 [Physcomitrium patens]PNR52434.1 hypothetical protein PHYPA_008808 [Physcomitrium patens]|eukprot:XP_024378682.1 uncharacterized protein LOC112283783 [Physcomitrella patens]
MLPSSVLEGACSIPTLFRDSCCGLPSLHVFDRRLCSPSVRVPSRSGWQSGTIRAVISEPSASDNAGESAADFVKRAERAWMISKQPRPLKCTSCEASGSKECVWCKGTGFFILGDSMLCEVPSRNTTCVICAGQGAIPCKDCKGTGFRAQWLGPPPVEGHKDGGADSPQP